MLKSFRTLLVALLCVSGTSVFAFTFQPMFVRLDSSGAGNVQTFEVRNESDDNLAVRFSVLTRAVDQLGDEVNEDASNLFTIYPARIIVGPNSSSAVKLQWKGPAKLAAEGAYRLVAENVALDAVGSPTSGIKVMFRYIASIYVGDADFSPDLVCQVIGTTSAAGKNGYNVEIENRGTRHVVAEAASIRINDGVNATDALDSSDLGSLSGANYLPRNPRYLFIPKANAVPGRYYNAQLEYESEY